MKCVECNSEIKETDTVCPSCGAANKSISNNNVVNQQGNNYGLAIASLVCSIIPFVTLLGFIFGLIVLSSNKGLSNNAKSLGLIGTVLSGITLFINIAIIVIFIMISFFTYVGIAM